MNKIAKILIQNTNGTIEVASNVRIADTFLTRLVGLLATKEFKEGSALVIEPCKMIHMFFMKYSIDVIFYSRNNDVVGLVKQIRPGQFSPNFSNAIGCIELPAQTIDRLNINNGDKLKFECT